MERFPFTKPSALVLTGVLWFGCLFAVTAILGTPTPASTPSPPSLPSAGQAPHSSPATGNGLVTIESDMQQGDNQTGVVTATGNVRITYPDRGMVATSRQAQYFSKEGRLVLSGDVDVIDDQGQRIRAERLVYNLDQERLVAQPIPGQQVRSKLRLSIPQGPGAVAPRP
jgi:lipopolysaccharide export system protein LptA